MCLLATRWLLIDKIVQKKTPQSLERGVSSGGKEPPDKLSVCIAEYNNFAVDTLSCPHSCPLVGWVDHT